MDWRTHPWAGVFPATLCAFHEDESIDEEGLRAYMSELAGVDGVKGLVCNGHTGEIMSLRPQERARVTRITAEAVAALPRRVAVVSGVSGDLAGAKAMQKLVAPLARLIYGFGEPSSSAHQRMKCARWLIGRFPSMTVRRPLRPLSEEQAGSIRTQLQDTGVETIR